jgi:hypothetical protein
MNNAFVFCLLNNILRRGCIETSFRVPFPEKDTKYFVSEWESQALLFDGFGNDIFTLETNVILVGNQLEAHFLL